MKISRHMLASFSAGLTLGILTKNLYAGSLCFIFGGFLDFDHILEFIIHCGIKEFSIKKVYQAFDSLPHKEGKYKFKKLYLFFHIAEIAFALWLLAIYTKNIYVTAIALGYSLHLIMDAKVNPVHRYFYFITWRMINNFSIDKLTKPRIKRED